MSSDVKKNVQICQGIDSYDDMVHDATQRFPELKDVEEPLGFIVDKYDLDSYPEFPQSCLRDCVANNDAGEEVEEQAAEAIEQLLPEYIDSFHILNSSSSLNYIFSPVITLPVPYKKDDAYSDCSLLPLRNSDSSDRAEGEDVLLPGSWYTGSVCDRAFQRQ